MLVIHFIGNVTEGVDNHLKWAKNVVAVQPDSKIVSHPIKIAAGNWTDMTGTLQGNIAMISLAHWASGKIAEEFLFWQMSAQYIE